MVVKHAQLWSAFYISRRLDFYSYVLLVNMNDIYYEQMFAIFLRNDVLQQEMQFLIDV